MMRRLRARKPLRALALLAAAVLLCAGCGVPEPPGRDALLKAVVTYSGGSIAYYYELGSDGGFRMYICSTSAKDSLGDGEFIEEIYNCAETRLTEKESGYLLSLAGDAADHASLSALPYQGGYTGTWVFAAYYDGKYMSSYYWAPKGEYREFWALIYELIRISPMTPYFDGNYYLF